LKKATPKSGQGLLIPIEVIESKIFVFRGYRVMLDRDLAELFGVETRVLNQAVSRNGDRFPDDFMFQLTLKEGKAVRLSRSQIVTLKRGQNIKYRPYAFTEHGTVMLANILRSAVAVRVSIQVVRAFVHLRQMLATNQDLARKIEALERRVGKHDTDLQAVLNVLQELLQPPPATKRPIGFVGPGKKY
jgi:phage regulator Rha-like protein